MELLLLYGITTSANASVIFQVYRRLHWNSSTYTVVPNSVTSLNLALDTTSVLNFTCGTVPPSSSFAVLPGDVIGVCLSGKQQLGVIGSASDGPYKDTLLHADANMCGLPFNPTDNSTVSIVKKILSSRIFNAGGGGGGGGGGSYYYIWISIFCSL